VTNAESKQRFTLGEDLIQTAQRRTDEPLPSKQRVGGSNPSGRAKEAMGLRHILERASSFCANTR
jgi:hypothetical protein